MLKTTAQAVVLEILRHADGEWTGKTKLFKAFYFAHLYYGLECPGILTDWPFARMPQGPGIHQSEQLFSTLVRDELMTIESIHEGPYPEYRFRLTEKGKKAFPLHKEAICAISESVIFCRDKTASELSALTHEMSRSWNEGKDGDIINIDLDLIPDEEYRKRDEELRELRKTLANVFPEAV